MSCCRNFFRSCFKKYLMNSFENSSVFPIIILSCRKFSRKSSNNCFINPYKNSARSFSINKYSDLQSPKVEALKYLLGVLLEQFSKKNYRIFFFILRNYYKNSWGNFHISWWTSREISEEIIKRTSIAVPEGTPIEISVGSTKGALV